MGDVCHLLWGNVELFRQYVPVARRLVQEKQEVGVFKDIRYFHALQKLLGVLGNTRRDPAPFAETLVNFR